VNAAHGNHMSEKSQTSFLTYCSLPLPQRAGRALRARADSFRVARQCSLVDFNRDQIGVWPLT
jgi:hypothetical protein